MNELSAEIPMNKPAGLSGFVGLAAPMGILRQFSA
jgi:hypothetical protein